MKFKKLTRRNTWSSPFYKWKHVRRFKNLLNPRKYKIKGVKGIGK